jgi:hypothetical protein
MTDSTTRAREILALAEVDGNHVRLIGQLSRPDYVTVNKAIEALGGKWNRKAAAHVFADDPADAIGQFLDGGPLAKPARTAEGYVPTPAHIATSVLEGHSRVGDLLAGSAVLEPSAGDGAFVRAILTANPYIAVVAVEPNRQRLAKVEQCHRVHRVAGTLEDFAAATTERFDAVVMNPPFAVPGQPTIWIDHVRLAFGLLADGGRLVAIVPAGLVYRQDRRHREMRDLVAEHGGFEMLPEDAFTSSGTSIRTAVLWLDRDGGAA